MPKKAVQDAVPDWLYNMARDKSFVQDNHPRREDMLQEQLFNARSETRKRQAKLLDKMPPPPPEPNLAIGDDVPEEPYDFGPGAKPPDFSGVRDFEPANAAPPPPSPLGPPLSAPDITTPAIRAARDSLPMPEDTEVGDTLADDPLAQMELMAMMTGMPVDEVATIAMLGHEAKKIEDQEREAGLPLPGERQPSQITPNFSVAPPPVNAPPTPLPNTAALPPAPLEGTPIPPDVSLGITEPSI